MRERWQPALGLTSTSAITTRPHDDSRGIEAEMEKVRSDGGNEISAGPVKTHKDTVQMQKRRWTNRESVSKIK